MPIDRWRARRGDQRLRYAANALRMIVLRDETWGREKRGRCLNSGLVARIPSQKPGWIDVESVCSTINYSIFQANLGLDLCSQEESILVKCACWSCLKRTLYTCGRLVGTGITVQDLQANQDPRGSSVTQDCGCYILWINSLSYRSVPDSMYVLWGGW